MSVAGMARAAACAFGRSVVESAGPGAPQNPRRDDDPCPDPPPDRTVLEELATANRILFHQNVVDGFGHVSVRHPDRPDHFLLARSMAPAMVTADDVMLFDPDSEPVGSDPRRPYLERFIHGEIYRLRPDVGAVVHSHSPSVVPFGIVPTVTLRPVFHMSGFLGQARRCSKSAAAPGTAPTC